MSGAHLLWKPAPERLSCGQETLRVIVLYNIEHYTTTHVTKKPACVQVVYEVPPQWDTSLCNDGQCRRVAK